jgi:hypothetical protein
MCGVPEEKISAGAANGPEAQQMCDEVPQAKRRDFNVKVLETSSSEEKKRNGEDDGSGKDLLQMQPRVMDLRKD